MSPRRRGPQACLRAAELFSARMLPASTDTAHLVDLARKVATEALAPRAAHVDQAAEWPAEGMAALAAAGFMGLHVPPHLGGHGKGLTALALIVEELGAACSSTAMCYGMHCVASAVIAAKATPFQEQRYLAPIAQGRHITSLAFSEPGTGSHFYHPQVSFRSTGRGYSLSGEKAFVTSAEHADSYVLSAVAAGETADPGSFTCLLLDRSAPGLEWGPPWQGLGMRGNASRGLKLNGAVIPPVNLLGSEGDQTWYVFEVVAPYFLVAMSAVYLGVARRALELATAHVQGRRHAHTGEILSTHAVLAEDLATMWTRVERTRQLLRHAARLWEDKDPGAAPALFASKIEVAETAAYVTQAALGLLGGRGYGEGGEISRLLRDAQAAHVMSPTTHLLKLWLGRALLGLPIF